MNLKRIAIVTVVCALILSVLGSTSVFAPPQTPLLPAPVEVVNPPDESLNVVVANDTLAVTLDESIEIVNPDGESLNVTLDEPIDVVITNTDSALNVSGWLHTTASGHEDWNTFLPAPNYDSVFIDTEGYREITVVFDSSNDTVVFGIAWELDGQFRWAEGWQFGDEKPPPFTNPLGQTPRYFFKTYSIQGEVMEIFWYAPDLALASGDLVSVAYYMTT
jgi:hypothetical protein